MKIPILPCEGNLDYHTDYALYAYIAALSPVLPHQIPSLKRHYAEKWDVLYAQLKGILMI